MSHADDDRARPGEMDHLLNHEYDGIQEYDNPLPMWWKAIFWATIVFTPLYVLFYHYGPGSLAHEKYDTAMVAFYDQQAKELLALGDITDTMLSDLRTNDSMMSNAKKVYGQRCATCHGVFAEGGIGPNLTDEFWIHGGRLTNIYDTIVNGVPEKGMLAWKKTLRPAEMMALASYVGTLQGSDPPNGKSPQGDPVDPADMVVPETADDPTAEGEISKDATGSEDDAVAAG
jgi:cytochrome c oxidase cbb3-type subunit 3